MFIYWQNMCLSLHIWKLDKATSDLIIQDIMIKDNSLGSFLSPCQALGESQQENEIKNYVSLFNSIKTGPQQSGGASWPEVDPPQEFPVPRCGSPVLH